MSKEVASDICEELERRFLTYALSTIVSRSLPDVRDGLKPIHRRTLYAMHNLGLNAAAKHVKSAKIIGEVLGKYHPHGDTSTYDSMVRMAQDFSMRYPLIDGKGNFGSVDGDSPAAFRYTEGRLSPISAQLLDDLKKDVVDFKANYDNTLQEPCVLPSKIPNLLINGSSGIAVGMACSFPSHNLTEVFSALIALIDEPKMSVKDLMKHIKGPDFPTNGIILNSKAELRQAYEEGKGSIKIRGEWKVEDLPRGKKQIILTSIPYGVNKAKLIEKIASIIIAKKLPLLVDIRDESDEAVRVVLELKGAGDPEKIMAYLFKHTEMENNYLLNFTCIKPNGEPDRLSLLEICQHFLDFRREIIIRRLTFELALIEKRLHILAGFVAIFSDLDKALKLIRSSSSRKEAHDKLKKAFKLDDEQVTAILEIPLYRLVSMEIDKILGEQKEKLKEKKRIESILKSQAKIWKEVKSELVEIKEKYGDKRRSKMKAAGDSIEYKEEDFVSHEDVAVILSRNGWLRKVKTFAGDPSSLKFKENDGLLGILQVNTRDWAALFTSFGMVYIQRVLNFPFTRGGGFGDPVQSLFKFGDGERVVALVALPSQESQGLDNDSKDSVSPVTGQQNSFSFMETPEQKLDSLEGIVISENGMGFCFSLANLTETTRAGKRVMTLKDDDRMLGFSLVQGTHVFLATQKGKGMRISLDQVTHLSGVGRGVKLIKLVDDRLVGYKCVHPKDKVSLVLQNGKTREILMKEVPEYNRGSQGVNISKRQEIVGLLE